MNNREIKFRALRLYHPDIWDYGYYFSDSKGHYIVDFEGVESCVDPKTLGQFMGRKDVNSKEIYDGDICPMLIGVQKYSNWEVGDPQASINGFVSWSENQLCWLISFNKNKYNVISSNFGYFSSPNIKIIGNIHQNPELLNK